MSLRTLCAWSPTPRQLGIFVNLFFFFKIPNVFFTFFLENNIHRGVSFHPSIRVFWSWLKDFNSRLKRPYVCFDSHGYAERVQVLSDGSNDLQENGLLCSYDSVCTYYGKFGFLSSRKSNCIRDALPILLHFIMALGGVRRMYYRMLCVDYFNENTLTQRSVLVWIGLNTFLRHNIFFESKMQDLYVSCVLLVVVAFFLMSWINNPLMRQTFNVWIMYA